MCSQVFEDDCLRGVWAFGNSLEPGIFYSWWSLQQKANLNLENFFSANPLALINLCQWSCICGLQKAFKTLQLMLKSQHIWTTSSWLSFDFTGASRSSRKRWPEGMLFCCLVLHVLIKITFKSWSCCFTVKLSSNLPFLVATTVPGLNSFILWFILRKQK